MPESVPLRSFGRRKGRKLKAGPQALYDTLLPKLSINVSSEFISAENLFGRSAPLWFEIGFGGGEHLLAQAKKKPNINFIGCEPYINGVPHLLSAIDQDNIPNIRIYADDARILLSKLADNSIERIFVLFPDPWPKIRHHKRRIISQETLALFYQKLAPGGLLRLVTDHIDYCTWMLEQLQQFGGFIWQAKNQHDWKNPPSDWVRTRYQAKAEEEGRGATFLDWVKPEI